MPRGVQSAPFPAGAATSLRAWTTEPRTATWSSVPPRTAAIRSNALASSAAGRSTRPPQRSECSSAATRPRPQTSAASGSATTSAGPVATAPRVATHSLAVWVLTRSSASVTSLVSASTPSSGPSVTTSTPRAARPSASSASVTSQRPGTTPVGVTGCQSIR